MKRLGACLLLAGVAGALLAPPARALDLNSFRAQHHLPPLRRSAQLAGAAYGHAHDMAARHHLDHNGFRARMAAYSSAAAENVAYGCSNADCAYRMWAKSAGHRRNMLMRGVTRYGIASAKASDGRVYWVLEMGN